MHNLLKTIGPSDKNLLYLASGSFTRPGYESLGFDNVVLVDKEFRRTSRNGCIFEVKDECLPFLVKCLEASVTFDAVVIINEGLMEGGGLYPLHADWFLGFLTAVVKDTYVHVACPKYYSWTGEWYIASKFLDLPFSKKELNSGDDGYLDPGDFCDSQELVPYSKVWRMERLVRRHVFQLGSVQCSVQQMSVCENRNHYDLIVVPKPFHRLNFMRNSLLLPKPRGSIKTIRAMWTPRILEADFDTMDDVLSCCGDEIHRVAMLPWLLGQYDYALDAISKYGRAPLEIDFFHLNASDFSMLYALR